MGNCSDKYDVPPHVKLIHLKNFGIDYDQRVRFNPETGQMMRLSYRSFSAKFQLWQLISPINDTLPELKPHPTIKHPRNYVISPHSTDIKIPKSERLRPDGADFYGEYLCGFKQNKWRTFVPIQQLLQCISQNKSYKTDTTNNIDTSGASTHQRHFHFSNDKWLSMNINPNFPTYISCDIYSLKTNDLIDYMPNLFKLPPEIIGKMDQIDKAQINENGCLTYNFQKNHDIFEYIYNEKGDYTRRRLHRSINGLEVIQKSKELAADKIYDKLFIYKFNDKLAYNIEKVDLLYKWKTINKLTQVQWFDDNTLIAYDNKYLYVFMNALKNKMKHEILLGYFGMSDLVKIVLDMIGFEVFGVWLCHNHGFGYRNEQNQNIDNVTLDFYFGKTKSYAIINKLKQRRKTIKGYGFDKHTLRTILVDLDHKYAAKGVVKAIEISDAIK